MRRPGGHPRRRSTCYRRRLCQRVFCHCRPSALLRGTRVGGVGGRTNAHFLLCAHPPRTGKGAVLPDSGAQSVWLGAGSFNPPLCFSGSAPDVRLINEPRKQPDGGPFSLPTESGCPLVGGGAIPPPCILLLQTATAESSVCEGEIHLPHSDSALRDSSIRPSLWSVLPTPPMREAVGCRRHR